MNDNHTIEVESQAIAVRPGNTAIGQALGVDEIIAQVRLIQEVMGKVMQEGEHFGKIPGCGDKKTLLQPGAQKLTMTFRLAPEYEIQESNLERGHKEYRVICTLKSIQSGTFVGQGVGCCSTMESKYRWRSAARKCPKCGKETIIKGKAEYGGGWLCFGKKGGCGAKWPDGAAEIESQSEAKVEHDNPADHFNTVLKMAKKRAFVDATITATAASDIFTQDIGDAENDDDSHAQESTTTKPSTQKPQGQRPAQSSQQASKPKPAAAEHAQIATEEQKARWLAMLKPLGVHALEYAREAGWIMPPTDENDPGEPLEAMSLSWVPATKKAADAILAAIQARMDGADLGPQSKPADAFQGQPGANTGGSEASGEPWYRALVPVPRRGMKRDEYLKSPDTIGSLYDARHDDEEARKRLFGFAHNFEPKGWQKRDGTQMPPSDADKKFRADLDAFWVWFKSNHPEECDRD